MFILGALGYYTNEELQKDKHLQYVAMTLRKKHFALKNGSAKKYYAFNDKKIKAYVDALPEKNHSFSSLRTATKMLEMLDFQIAHHYTKIQQNEKSIKC